MFNRSRILVFTVLFSFAAPLLAQQMPILSKACPAGTKEAQALFQTGMLVRSGKGGEKKIHR